MLNSSDKFKAEAEFLEYLAIVRGPEALDIVEKAREAPVLTTPLVAFELIFYLNERVADLEQQLKSLQCTIAARGVNDTSY